MKLDGRIDFELHNIMCYGDSGNTKHNLIVSESPTKKKTESSKIEYNEKLKPQCIRDLHFQFT